MTIFTNDRIRPTSYLEEYDAPMADVMAVSAEGELVRGPTASLLHSVEFTAAEEGALTPAADIGLGALGAVFPGYSLYRIAGAPGLPSWFREPPESPMLDAATARQRIADTGFKLEVPDSGIREGALRILLDAKREQRLRDSVLARTPERIGPKRSPWWPDWAQRAAPGALRVGSGLLASAIEPSAEAGSFVGACTPGGAVQP